VTEQTTLPPATADKPVITRPDAYADFPEAAYHDDPVPGGSLSSTGARKLIEPGCPRKYKYWLDHKEPYKTVFEIGKAAHRKTLGVGPDLVIVEGDGKKGAEVWDTDKARAKVAAAREAGHVPLKPSQMTMVDEMASALRDEPMAVALLDPAAGSTELSLFWRERTVWGRARLDRLTRLASGRMAIVDYKSVTSAAPAKVEKAMRDNLWHVQGAFYKHAAQALALVDESALFLLLCQEKEPPYLATVVEPDMEAMAIGAIRVRQAFDDYAEAMTTGVWRGYADGPVYASLPSWETRELRGEVW
jgi:hypothetical protein